MFLEIVAECRFPSGIREDGREDFILFPNWVAFREQGEQLAQRGGSRQKDLAVLQLSIITARKMGDRMILRVRDNGRGMSLKQVEEMNQKFSQPYFLHYPVAEEEVTIQERMETMEELKKAGKIRAIGLSNFSLEEMKAAMKFGQVDVIQPCYSLLWRYDEALLEFSRKQEISVIPYSTLAQGLLTGKYQKGAVFTDGRARAALFQPENYDRCLEVTDVLSQISAKYGKTPAQGAIAWLLQTQGITAPIVGAKNGRQAQENLKAAGWQFSKEDYDVIDRASRRFMEGLPHYTLFFNTETTN